MKKPLVYIADLRHSFAGVLGTDCMPLGTAYIKALLDRDVPDVESRFSYPNHLLEAMKTSPPDVVMCSNYLWNETLSLQFLKLAKAVNPEAITIMGGPNLHIEPERQLQWFQESPFLDAYILGEGEFVAANLMQRYVDAGMSRRKFLANALPSTIRRNPDGTLTREESWARIAKSTIFLRRF